MRERGMIFNADMVRAVLNGSKTQTRRLIDWRRTTRATEIAERDDGSNWPWSEDCENGGDYWHACPFGAVGDRLWVRETFGFEIRSVGGAPHEQLVYRASKPDAVRLYDCNGKPHPMKWTPSLHMRRKYSRITLEITGVRVERLRDMTERDAIAEGCLGGHDSIPGYMYSATPHEHFHHVWESIYGEESWQANPWVWVIEFKRVEGGSHD
ncbi:Phage-related protein [Pantoea sp. AS-PWVM4]|uniref:phage-related protein n=1 Tax=Pantoea sp. AS-PWVM4 TaxID=1332069 RepID=UPI0003AC5C3B|nr:phage-related protein [Pantoea sp. AS-PWVM4]ERK18584.1 Phage-related protein [Pantoea sp. AS-PWVM4]